jgi:outer membrane lipoprotein-sorting protein
MLAGAVLGAVLFLSGCGQKNTAQNTPPANQAASDQAASNAPAADQASNSPADNSAIVSGPQSLHDLIGMGKDMECTWKTTDDKGKETDGKMNISGPKFKMDMAMDNPNGSGKIDYYTLSDGTWVYTWGMMPNNTGTKMKFEDVQKVNQGVADSGSQSVAANKWKSGEADWQKKYDYQCAPWTASDSDLTPPSDINFMDMTQLINTSLKGLNK